MTAKQARFAEEYLIDFNATRAAIRAGYSPNGAGPTGNRLLKNKNVRARVDEASPTGPTMAPPAERPRARG